jgi:hypothetical protein
LFVQLIILCNVKEQKEVRDAKAMRPMAMLKLDKTFRAASASNKWQSTVQLLTLWREEAATECGSGPSKSTIVDILDVAEVVESDKWVIQEVSVATKVKKVPSVEYGTLSRKSGISEAIIHKKCQHDESVCPSPGK